MPIFELGRAISVKSHVWKFGLDWLRLSRGIVVKKKKKKMKTSKNARLWSARRVLTIVESIWKSGILPYLVANRSGLRGVHNVFGDSFCRTVWGVCLDLVHFFFFSLWPWSSEVCERGVNSLKTVEFLINHPLNSIFHLRGCITFLEIVFVGQCDVFVCLNLKHFFLATKLIGPRTGCLFFKNCWFFH